MRIGHGERRWPSRSGPKRGSTEHPRPFAAHTWFSKTNGFSADPPLFPVESTFAEFGSVELWE